MKPITYKPKPEKKSGDRTKTSPLEGNIKKIKGIPEKNMLPTYMGSKDGEERQSPLAPEPA